VIDRRSFTADDAWLFAEGRHAALHDVLGAHPDDEGTVFRVWAPNARAVSVLTDGNGWTPGRDELEPDPSGVWRGRIGGMGAGARYKFAVVDAGGAVREKADPCAFRSEEPPATASVVADLSYVWDDAGWMEVRAARQAHDAPVSIYELHLGSWRYEPGGYRAIAAQLADYVADLGFTHVELLPVTEHPFYGSWGYQTTGYFSASSRYGAPQDLMAMIDLLHRRGIGVLLDWVPSHFPHDAHALGFFDGSHLYEHADPREGHHPDWDSLIFNYGRHEVRSFLLSSARFWLDRFHADGLRVDAVASMLYRDYSRREGEWVPNVHGGRENLEAVAFLQDLNRMVHEQCPGAITVAEESTAWPGVTRPVEEGGLGFDLKWDMGWMHDTLQHFARQPVHRGYHLDELTFRAVYAWSERYVLPLSHDEVVHGKGSLLGRMPGDRWQQLANLRLLLGMEWGTPGKKLLFMGGELAQPREWNHESELDWWLLADPAHRGVHDWVAALNALLVEEPALHRVDDRPEGFSWLIGDDPRNTVLAWVRQAPGARPLVVVANLTPAVRDHYRVGVPSPGSWVELLSGDDERFGGSGVVRTGPFAAAPVPAHGCAQSVSLRLPPLAVVFLAPDEGSGLGSDAGPD
jgi:1,4-alpha-glucan branching enzyme